MTIWLKLNIYCNICKKDNLQKIALKIDSSDVTYSLFAVCLNCKEEVKNAELISFNNLINHQKLMLILNLSSLMFCNLKENINFLDFALDLYYAHNPWIKQYMEAMDWKWICVCGAKVIAGSADLENFPTEQAKLKISADNNGLIPFCYQLNNKSV